MIILCDYNKFEYYFKWNMLSHQIFVSKNHMTDWDIEIVIDGKQVRVLILEQEFSKPTIFNEDIFIKNYSIYWIKQNIVTQIQISMGVALLLNRRQKN